MLYFLKDSPHAPWDSFQESISARPDKTKYFAGMQGRLSGFIIVWWQEDSLYPTMYLPEFPSSSLPSPDSDGGDWQRFDDDSESENPKQYRRLSMALRAIERLRAYHKTERIGLVFWCHPESDYQPKDKYIQILSGKKFPGNPRR